MRSAIRPAEECKPGNLTKELKLQIKKNRCWTTNKTKEEGLIPTGTLKREWIAMDTGFSARSVQDYLNLLEEHPNKEKKESRSLKYEDIQNSMHDAQTSSEDHGQADQYQDKG